MSRRDTDAATIDAHWDLVDRAKAGDTEAFAAIYATYQRTVFRFIQHRVPELYTAEDLAQDVWVRATRNLARVERQSVDFGAWLCTIARNIVADHYKSRRVQLTALVDDMRDWDLAAVDDPERETVGEVMRAAAERLLTEAMADLTPAQKRVLELRFYDGRSTIETAAELGQEVGAAKALQTRATAAIRRKLLAGAR